MQHFDLEPTNEYPVPYNLDAEEPDTFEDALEVAANTIEVQVALGAQIEVEPGTESQIKGLLKEAIEKKKASNLNSQPVAYAASAFLREYGNAIAIDIASTRTAITAKLMEIANCGDPKFELKALELLGKHSDIGLFTDRSELTIRHTSPESLEEAIKERVKRILNTEIIDITPVKRDLDDIFGVAE